MICRALLIGLLALTLPLTAAAHGGVVEEDDICVIKVNFLRAHFKIYQPAASGHEQFCEDLPAATESVFVMEYMHDALQTMPIDFRIIRDVTGKGRFARLEDVQEIADIESVTVFYREPVHEPDVYTISHTFEEEGNFIGIVSASHPETGVVYASVFPFEVGFTGWGYWPFFIGLLIMIQIQYLHMSGRLKRWFGHAAPAAVALVALAVSAPAFATDYVVTIRHGRARSRSIGMHSWVLHVETDDGQTVEGATISIEGGMPEHDHGLPTEPRVTEELGDGDYILDGLRFHMGGEWELVFTISSDHGEGSARVILTL